MIRCVAEIGELALEQSGERRFLRLGAVGHTLLDEIELRAIEQDAGVAKRNGRGVRLCESRDGESKRDEQRGEEAHKIRE